MSSITAARIQSTRRINASYKNIEVARIYNGELCGEVSQSMASALKGSTPP